MGKTIGDQRYQPEVWAFGQSTEDIIHDARTKAFSREWDVLYEAALIIGRPVGGSGRLQQLWTIKDKHRVFPVPMACRVIFTRRKTDPETYIELPLF